MAIRITPDSCPIHTRISSEVVITVCFTSTDEITRGKYAYLPRQVPKRDYDKNAQVTYESTREVKTHIFPQTVYCWGSIVERKELATLTGRAPELCGWALWLGLVLLLSSSWPRP